MRMGRGDDILEKRDFGGDYNDEDDDEAEARC